MDMDEAIKEIQATPIGAVMAAALGVLVANEELLKKYPGGEGAPQELKDYATAIAMAAADYMGEGY